MIIKKWQQLILRKEKHINDFVEYDKDEIYNILIYDTNTDKALYDPDSYELINLTNRLILGQK